VGCERELVLDGGRFERGVLPEELDQPRTHMIDVVAHGGLRSFTIVFFKRLKDGEVGVNRSGSGEIVGFAAAQPDLVLNILQHAAKLIVAGRSRKGSMEAGIFFDVLDFVVGSQVSAGALDTFGEAREQGWSYLGNRYGKHLQRFSQVVEVFYLLYRKLPQTRSAPWLDMDQALGL
jgi:hypothetical protein